MGPAQDGVGRVVLDETIRADGAGARYVTGPPGRWRMTVTVRECRVTPPPIGLHSLSGPTTGATVKARNSDVPCSVEAEFPTGRAQLSWGDAHKSDVRVEVVS